MKRQIRRGVYETNSSSVHAITMCMGSDYDKWIDGELIWDRWDEVLIPITDQNKESIEDDKWRYLTYERFNDYEYVDQETFEDGMTTPSGERVVAFGYYGHD